MGFVVALLVLGAWCGSCSAQRQRACVEAGKSDVCICSSATSSMSSVLTSLTAVDVPLHWALKAPGSAHARACQLVVL
uniref:Variable lymphocyte receptor C n=1 Tax=Petromyzon marinus TaxID=7757 RepID=A0A088S9Y3_PETMA|nr:variable lymphocyte receptor C [Petromyzon marinus]